MQIMADDMAMPSMSASGQVPSFVAVTEASCLSAPCCTVSIVTAPQLAAPAKFSQSGVVSLTPTGELSGVVAPFERVRQWWRWLLPLSIDTFSSSLPNLSSSLHFSAFVLRLAFDCLCGIDPAARIALKAFDLPRRFP